MTNEFSDLTCCILLRHVKRSPVIASSISAVSGGSPGSLMLTPGGSSPDRRPSLIGGTVMSAAVVVAGVRSRLWSSGRSICWFVGVCLCW